MTLFSLIYWYILSLLKRVNYHSYLKSRAWQFRRRLVWWWTSSQCQLCSGRSEQLDVHHRTYIRLGRERLTDLTLLCHTHHEQFHAIRRFE